MSKFDDFIKQVDNTIGVNTAVVISEMGVADVDVIPTGVQTIDKATGIGGFPRGKISEVFGKEASGKTTLCLQGMAEAQKMGLTVAFIDMEHAINFDRMKKLGVDTENMVFSQPDNGEQALNLVEMMVRDGRFHMIVVDSVAALVPLAEVEKDVGDSVMGVQARMMSQAMRKLTAPVNKQNVALVFVNQTRSKIGVSWGNPETTTGGVALKFYSSLRMRIVYTGKVMDGSDRVGSKGKITVVKNKLAVPFKEAEFVIDANGINCDMFTLKMLVESGTLEKAGTWFKYKGETIGQGVMGTMANLKENPKLYKEILKVS